MRTSGWTGIVLAAGEGRRMGCSKAGLELDGHTLLERHVARLEEIGAAEVLVVVRERAAVPPVAWRGRALVAATRSQAESLAVAVAALAEGTDAVLVTPVDLLPPAPATLRALVAALAGDVLAVTPTFGGRGGHPVVVRPAVLAPYRNAAPPLNRVLAALGSQRLRLRVDDPTITGDFDTPADWRRRVVTCLER